MLSVPGYTAENHLPTVLFQDRRRHPSTSLNIAAIVFHPNLGQSSQKAETLNIMCPTHRLSQLFRAEPKGVGAVRGTEDRVAEPNEKLQKLYTFAFHTHKKK